MIKVLVVDDNKIVRNGIIAIIEQDKDIKVVGSASNGKEAIDASKEYLPDIVLMDIEMPICNGIEATKAIKEFNSDIKVIVLTVFEDDEKISLAMANRADGYILKDIKDEELINAIKYTIKGFSFIHQNVLKSISENYKDQGNSSNIRNPATEDKLTVREKEIIKLIVEGSSNKIIASELKIAEGTVRNIISNMLAKLNLYDRTQLAVYAIKNNIV